ncbi:hypothetical protein C0Z18_07835 [Trinickia dabaoshanensis]|uniref:Uncharacterized protein n=1 Tax=Trinickia dabaoshanensis TaxID=564714 RepID=A0A2N7VVD0_9BURK|nr:hypothetical protein [Trinickia dabaoshanensis]PMS21101.1 hypothetical protein C0Z18_07835 [Trinickia dabaoshanensis]
MSALRLTTRFRQDAYEGEASLLVYDEYEFTESTLSEDVRHIFDQRPATANIYVLAPFADEATLVNAIASGVAVKRARRYFEGIGGRVRLLGIEQGDGEKRRVSAIPFEYAGDEVRPGRREALDSRLCSGWLFDLFHRGSGLVEAPAGVHFGKVSGRHSNKFLRASGPLLSSEACAAVAFFAFAAASGMAPSRIFVDTAPIIAVAFAMARMAIAQGLWDKHPPVKSFSSYGGVEKLPRRRPTDFYLISASTSGGLARRLVNSQVDKSRIVTLFYLGSGAAEYDGSVVCNLTYRNDGLFGYPPVSNYPAQDCPFCKEGYFLAQLEGDQFLLERRAIKRLAVRSAAQPKDAREAVERLARTGCLDVTLFKSAVRPAGVALDAESLLDADAHLRGDFIRMLRRFTPAPLNYVALVGLSEEKFFELVKEAGLETIVANSAITTDGLEGLKSVPNGTALVVFGCLCNHAHAREINARMRTLVPGGSVAYLSAVTIAETAQALAELDMFLSFGERGRDTFTFRSALQFMLPAPVPGDTSWEAEHEKLLLMREKKALAPELQSRLDTLNASAHSSNQLFFSGCRPSLEIARDFVYLDTKDRRHEISQADVFAVVVNILACARAENHGLAGKPSRSGVTAWSSSVYGHVLVCPSNFAIYNDAVLRAAFLRAASPSELLYSMDEECSTEMLNVILAEADAWGKGGGDALPEFLLALAIGRMRLARGHCEELCARLNEGQLPEYLRDLAREIEALQHPY